MKNRKMIGNALLMLTALIWGGSFAAQRAGMETIEPFTFNSTRMMLAAVAVGTVTLVTARRRNPAVYKILKVTPEEYRRNTITGGLCCGIFLTSASNFQQSGIVYTTAGKCGFITAMYMLLVPVVSFLVFHKKNSAQVWLAVLLGLAGMYLLCINENFSLNRGDILVFIGAWLYCGHILCCDHFVRKANPVGISAIQFTVVSVITGILALTTETPSWDKIRSAAIPILYCGLFSGGIGYTLQMVAQSFTDPTVASLLMSLESVFAVLAGAILLHEQMSMRELLGCLVMFSAILLVQIPIPGISGGEMEDE